MRVFKYCAFLFLIFCPSVAFANCTLPSGMIGEIRFESSTETMKMCKTTGWEDMGGTSSGSPSNATAINYNDCHQISTKATAYCNVGYFPVMTQCSGNQGRCSVIKDPTRYGIEGHAGGLLAGILTDPSWASALCCQIVDTPNNNLISNQLVLK